MTPQRLSVPVVLAVAIATLLLPSRAVAAETNPLAKVDCFAGTPAPCAGHAVVPGLRGAHDVDLSPDGRQVYVLGGVQAHQYPSGFLEQQGTIQVFNRAPGQRLQPASCVLGRMGPVYEPDGAASCGGPAEIDGMDGGSELVISPDGRDVYVAGGRTFPPYSSSIAHFRRAADGSLSYAGCIDALEFTNVCPSSPGRWGARAAALGGARGLTFSPDGTQLYVAASGDNAITRLSRASDGTLTDAGCYGGTTTTVQGCASVVPGGTGLTSVVDLAMSADGTRLFSAAPGDHTVWSFARGVDGSLSSRSCFEGSNNTNHCGGPDGHIASLFGVTEVTVAPDGSGVYATGGYPNAITFLPVSGDGNLSVNGCVEDVAQPAETVCGPNSQIANLQGVARLAVTPDGQSLLALANTSNAIWNVRLLVDGRLDPMTCVGDVASTCPDTASGLHGPAALAVAPDGATVYVASYEDGTLTELLRQVPPRCEVGAAVTARGAPVSVPLSCSDANGDPVALEIVSGPRQGVLGTPSNGAVTYTPPAGFTGEARFAFRAVAAGRSSAPTEAVVIVTAAAVVNPVVVLASKRFTGRTGRKVKVGYVGTGTGAARLVVTRGSKRVVVVDGALPTAGLGTLSVPAKPGKKALKPGSYRLQLTLTTVDGGSATATAKLKITR